jgi:hypothetical protein
MFFYVTLCVAAVGFFFFGWIVGDGLQRMSERNLHNTRLKNILPHVEALRRQKPGNSGWAENIIKDVAEGWFTYEELGTTEKELKELGFRLDYKERALHVLGSLRRTEWISFDFEGYIQSLPGYLQKAGLTLRDVGCSEEEFTSFARTSEVTLARYYWRQAQGELPLIRNALDWLSCILKRGKVAPSDFGATPEDLKKMTLAFE